MISTVTRLSYSTSAIARSGTRKVNCQPAQLITPIRSVPDRPEGICAIAATSSARSASSSSSSSSPRSRHRRSSLSSPYSTTTVDSRAQEQEADSSSSSMASSTPTNLVEAAKRAACRQAVAENFRPEFRYVGIGSGSTVAYVVEAIAERGRSVTSKIKFVPTGSGSTNLIRDAGLAVLQVADLLSEVAFAPGQSQQHIDVYFDGADEVDAELNCIKGGGACLFQEKVVSRLSKRFVCVADSRKKAPRLLSGWKYVPVEVSPAAAELVRRVLVDLGSVGPVVRTSGPTFTHVITDNHNYIIDAPFKTLLLNSEADKMDAENGVWTPDALGEKIRSILGVLEVGIFSGINGPEAAKRGPAVEGVKPVKIYFGKGDGGVETLE